MNGLFEVLKRDFCNKKLTPLSHQVPAAEISEFPPEQLVFLDSLTAKETQRGLEILKKRKWARLILNGGMATRFGGRVKGICEVYEGKTFLQLKLEHLKCTEESQSLPEIPVALMCSHATEALTRQYLEKHHYFNRSKLRLMTQRDFPRLQVNRELFKSSDEKSRAPCGHGDFLETLQQSGVFADWEKMGITHFDFSNIDNLGATLELDMVGAFVDSGRLMAVELAKKNPGDKGGAACMRRGVAGVLEGLYFDPQFDQDRLPWFNTNNLMFSMQGLRQLFKDPDFELPWNVVFKNVEGQEVVQFERIAIDTVFAFNRQPGDDQVLFFGVPREGARGRFYPIKSPEDLIQAKDKLKNRLSQGISRQSG